MDATRRRDDELRHARPSRLGLLVLSAALGLVLLGCDNGDETGVSTGSDPDVSTFSAVRPACEDIEAFADVLTDTSIEYDYSASDSPAEQASSVDVVFGGQLTGIAEPATADLDEPDLSGHSRNFIGYEVLVTQVVQGDVDVDDTVSVYVEYGFTPPRDDYIDAVAPGAPVVIMGYESGVVDGILWSLEGFITSCPDGPLLGWTGSQGAWNGLRTTEDVLKSIAADDPPGERTSSTQAPPDEPAGSGQTVTVTLWHCGVEPVTVDGRTWEVPESESVDGSPDLPLDATNTPLDWLGTGTVTVRGDAMTYTDGGGEVVEFVPDDGRPPPPCS